MTKKEFGIEIEEDLRVYAEEVNKHRALPSIEDGLRPSSRMLLYCLYKSKNFHDKPYVKCAKPIGDTLANYYVHGDAALYGVLVNLAQDWKNNVPLIDFHGGYATADPGSTSSAYRYTECRLSKQAELLFADLNYDTTEWEDNYLQTEKVPKFIKSAFPNLLVNPTLGIGWSMACNFLPHSYEDVKAAIKARINKEPVVLRPSFPSGGVIMNGADLQSIYNKGRGTIIVRGTYTTKNNTIIITSLPYRVGPKKILSQILELQEQNKFLEVKEISNNSNDDGVSIEIVLSSKTNIDEFIVKLAKYTSFEETFALNQTALVDGKPKLLSLTQILDYYIKQQHTRLIKKNTHIKNAAAAKLHIQEGLLLALSSIDEVIAIIRAANDTDDARTQLIKLLSISKEQADAILDIKLSRLTKLSAQSIADLITSLKAEIADAEDIIASPERRISVLYAELDSIQQTSTSETTVLNESSILNKLGQQVAEPFKLTIDGTSYHTSDGALVSPEDPLYIITEESKVILLKAAALKYAEDFTPLQGALPNIKQKIIGAFTTLPASLSLYSSIGKETFKKDILEYAATPRGRRLSAKKTTFQIKQ